VTRVNARYNEDVKHTLRRFKKLIEREGIVKDVKKREFYEKPSERKNRIKRKKIKDNEKLKLISKQQQRHHK